MKTAERRRLRAALTPRLTSYIPHTPTVKQQAGLLLPHREVMYGGAAGGGKSDWLLMAALQYVDIPGYSALLLRRSYRELLLQGGLMQRARDWLLDTDARWVASESSWYFPSGAKLTFGYLENVRDHERYQGSDWMFVGFDELTQFREAQYRYLFSRLRRPQLAADTPAEEIPMIEALQKIPLRMRSASNPGGVGHEWAKSRFGIYAPEDNPDGQPVGTTPAWVEQHDRVFVAAGILDNPHLDAEDYKKSLAELDPVTRAQLLNGDWSARAAGDYFRAEWFRVVEHPPKVVKQVRFWDLAATEKSAANDDPDWTAGVRMGLKDDGSFVVLDVRRFRKRPDGVEKTIRQTAENDGRNVPIRIEQEGGSGGKNTIWNYQRAILPEYDVKGVPASGKGGKELRAQPVSARAESGMIECVRGPWLLSFLDELESFPGGGHDDQVDAISGAWEYLATKAAAPGVGPDVWR